MATKDLHSKVAIIDVIGPVSLNADNTPAAIDLSGYDQVELVIGVGIGGVTFSDTDKIEFTWTTSETSGGTYAAVSAADVLGEASIGSGGIVKSLTAAHAAAAHYRFGYRGPHAFHKILANFSGTHGTATPIDVHFVCSGARLQPIAADA